MPPDPSISTQLPVAAVRLTEDDLRRSGVGRPLRHRRCDAGAAAGWSGAAQTIRAGRWTPAPAGATCGRSTGTSIACPPPMACRSTARRSPPMRPKDPTWRRTARRVRHPATAASGQLLGVRSARAGTGPLPEDAAVEALEPVGGRGPKAARWRFDMVTTKAGRRLRPARPHGQLAAHRGEQGRPLPGDRLPGRQQHRQFAKTTGPRTSCGWTDSPSDSPMMAGQRWEERYTEYKVTPATGAVTSVNHVDVWTVTAVGAGDHRAGRELQRLRPA